MLRDEWVIVQLLVQTGGLALLLGATVFSFRLIRTWSEHHHSEAQIRLERQSYLLGAVLAVVFWSQALSLLFFLHTVNVHLTEQIEGAMCATGILGLNDFGYPLLFLKLLALGIYGSYLICNHFDNREPGYPLTPFKFWLLFPATALLILDVYLSFRFFGQISPSIITTCCSVSFAPASSPAFGWFAPGAGLHLAKWGFHGGFGLLCLAIGWAIYKKPVSFGFWLALGLVGLVYVSSAVYALRYEYVKYIYGLPTHLCMFDIFWLHYGGIGYVIFGTYAGLLFGLLYRGLYAWFSPRLAPLAPRSEQFWGGAMGSFLCLSYLVPLGYQWAWGYAL
ncbi:MAG: hypothetical protein OHK0053_08430 [Microscillaceae bacterium]